MGLEQLLPGGLYSAVVREYDKRNKPVKFTDYVPEKLTAGVFEMVRDLNYLALPLVLVSNDVEPKKKALGVALFSAHYAAMTYGIPLFCRGLTYVRNKLDDKLTSLENKTKN